MSDTDAEAVKELLTLQELEQNLVRLAHEHPGALRRRDYARLRYALGFSRLTEFQPGAAVRGGRSSRPDVAVSPEVIRSVRGGTLELLSGPLRDRSARSEMVVALRAASAHLLPVLSRARRTLLERHANDFTAEELDEEAGRRVLVTVGGGGGGAAWVYVGAFEVLQEAGLVPRYVSGSSMGSVIGLFRARDTHASFDDYVGYAKTLRYERVFRPISLRVRFGFPGLFQLYLHRAIGIFFNRPDGSPMRISDLDIPYEAIVAGIRRNAFEESPEAYARSHHLETPPRGGWISIGPRIFRQLVQLVEFVNPRIVKEIVIGGDDLTRDFNAVDAAGFSSAIPGILHYDLHRRGKEMEPVLEEILRREDAVALVDGGVANNVPARVAWHQVRRGKIGTRNAFVLAFDCFQPQWSPKHLWLQPLTRAVEAQVAINRPYADRLIRFHPTLSPVTLLPAGAGLDRAIEWGRRQMARELPLLMRSLEPVRWET